MGEIFTISKNLLYYERTKKEKCKLHFSILNYGKSLNDDNLDLLTSAKVNFIRSIFLFVI